VSGSHVAKASPKVLIIKTVAVDRAAGALVSLDKQAMAAVAVRLPSHGTEVGQWVSASPVRLPADGSPVASACVIGASVGALEDAR